MSPKDMTRVAKANLDFWIDSTLVKALSRGFMVFGVGILVVQEQSNTGILRHEIGSLRVQVERLTTGLEDAAKAVAAGQAELAQARALGQQRLGALERIAERHDERIRAVEARRP